MNALARAAPLLLMTLLVAACAGLPEYAQPRMEPGGPNQVQFKGFTYRALTREDFRAPDPPESLGGHAERINAHSAIRIRPSLASRFAVTRNELFRQPYFFGRIEHVSFEAVMIPERSWWNPAMQPSAAGYVLQHEQIHFALTELAARRLTRDTAAWAAGLLVIKPDPQEVRAEIARQIGDLIRTATEANLQRHTKFDEDCSLFYSPKRQQWWAWEVETELKETAPAGSQNATAAP